MKIAKPEGTGNRVWSVLLAILSVTLAVVALNTQASAQTFSSGSDGSDGALTPTVQNCGPGTIFDPFETARWGKVLDPDGDGVYNFTTITIPAGCTLKLQGDKVNTPMYWLASGDVVINGTLDISGANGSATSDLNVRRQVAVPGSGGYAGGAGGFAGVAVTPGGGPGGGSGGTSCTGWGAYASTCGKGGVFSGNRYLVPLVGGSGGEGALASGGSASYFSGGAGGGAILIASSTAITVTGTIAANGAIGGGLGGCPYGFGGGGSGGAVRLVAPTLSGNGHLDVRGACGVSSAVLGGSGWVRLEGFAISNSLALDAGSSFSTRGSPIDPTTLRPASSIRVTAIDGVQVPANPSGSFVLPDVSIRKNGLVNVDIQATGVPPGTVVTLQVYPQTPTDLTTVNLTAQTTLVGTLESSTATAMFTFPYGFSRGFVRATWTQ